MINYYFDESGFTGNLKIKNEKFNTNNNNIFTLVGVGVSDGSIDNLSNDIISLKNNFKIQSVELKSTQIIKSYDKFLLKLLELLPKHNVTIFIEVINKHYFLYTQLIENIIFSPIVIHKTKYYEDRRKEFSLIFYKILPLNLVENYSHLIHNPSSELFENFFKNLILFLKNYLKENKIYSFEITLMLKLIINIYDFYLLELEKYSNPNKQLFEYFLPLGDFSRTNKFYNTYYHINCFTNIVSKINNFSFTPKIVNLIHDNQLESKIILENILNLMKQDYNLPDYYNLTFEDSKNNILIQVADILAGVSRKFTEKYLAKNLSLIENEIFEKVIAISDMNFVLPFKL